VPCCAETARFQNVDFPEHILADAASET
jgi:hypothetical protein